MTNETISSTIAYYDQNANTLISSYESANMSDFHNFLVDNLIPNTNVLDIGFGSGRDLSFLQKQGFDIWGIDPSEKFVEYAKKRFSLFSNHFFTGALPNIGIDHLPAFDNIIMVAVWMHIPKVLHQESIKAIASLLKPHGRLVLSYSITPRIDETTRHFEDIDPKTLQALFEKNHFTQITKICNNDGLGKREIKWITEVYNYDKP